MYEAKDPTNRGRIAIVLIRLWLAAELLERATSLLAISALGGLGGDIATDPQLHLADLLTEWTAACSLGMFAVTGIAVLRWISLTNRNAHTWSDQVDITPGWAIGWFFVPFASLFKPFEGVSATWRATVAPADIPRVPVPSILRWWWGLWLAMNFSGYLPTAFLADAAKPEQLIAARWTSIATIGFDIPLAVVLVRIIARLSAMQRALLTQCAGTIDEENAS